MDGSLTKLHARRGLAIAAFCLAVAGCTADGVGPGANLEDSVQPQQARMIALAPEARKTTAASRPPVAALPSDAGIVASVRTRDYTDGFRQDIALGGSAIRTIGNGITVMMRTSRQQTLDESVPLAKPSEGAIRSEIGAQFPHISMQVVERQSSNSYGPYGLALGRAPNDVRCLYMWQWIDANRLPQGAGLTGPGSVRIRMCLAGTTFDTMAAALDHLVIGREAASSAPDRVATDELAQVIVDAGSVPHDGSTLAEAFPAKKPARKRHVAKRKPMPKLETALVAPAAAGVRAPLPPGDLPPQAYLGPTSNSRPAASPPSARN